MNFIGRSDNLLLFTHEDAGVVIDSEFNLVVTSGKADALRKSNKWVRGEVDSQNEALAYQALVSVDAALTASAGRRYTIPRGTQNAAKKGLESPRLTSPAIRATATLLASGGQIDMGQLRRIVHFFEKYSGTSMERSPHWKQMGGDTTYRWAKAIVEREKPVVASGGDYRLDNIHQDIPDHESFRAAHGLDPETGPEFLARVRLDGSGMDRLYKIDFDGRTYVWDAGEWDDLGNVENDIWAYDHALDDPYDQVEKSHIVIDPDSAVIIGARFATDPFTYVTVEDIDEDEARLAQGSEDEIDWQELEFALIAAGETVNDDGVYDPKERSQNASKQVRDGSGKFAKVGSRVMVGGNPSATGNITRVNPADGTVSVQLESGESVDVPGASVEGVGKYTATVPGAPVEVPRIDTTGILGEPRTPVDRPNAQLPGTLPAMTDQDLQSLLYDWPAWVSDQRASYKGAAEPKGVKVQPKGSMDKGKEGRDLEKRTGAKMTTDVYDHPLLRKWTKKKDRQGHNNVPMWYNPMTAAGAPEQELTPETTDVQPVYMAIVAPEDPRAVLHLVSLVPASSTSNAPMTYTREEGVWKRNEAILNDLNSATPPAVVPLDSETLTDVIEQVDESQGVEQENLTEEQQSSKNQPPIAPATPAPAVTAAGGADRNRGGAEKLRRYWVKGPGAAKIMWGTKGDWRRCVKHLGKHLGTRAKGYCQLRHKEATGIYTGAHKAQHSVEDIAKYLQSDSEAVRINAAKTILEFTSIDKWEPEAEILELMQDKANFAGGADRNRGNAEKLRNYWTRGAGAAKVRWGQPGDWKRCVRQLSKHIADAEGYCALRHKEAVGNTPSQHHTKHRDHSVVDFATVTQVTREDLDTPIDVILAEEVENFDATWTPDSEIVEILDGLTEDVILAAGGLDRNRGKAEELRRYWTRGAGGAKIRWNTPGDWTRCVRYLTKYLGPRSRGYCALRHKEMTGMWTGDQEHRQLATRTTFSTDIFKDSESILAAAFLRAQAQDARERMGLVASAGEEVIGARFSIPLIIPEGMESGDERMIGEGALTWRDLPLPLMWQIKTASGHDGSVVVGRIDHMERTPLGIGNAYGVFDTGPYGREAERMVRQGFLRGVSADLDKFKAEEQEVTNYADSEGDDPETEERTLVKKARIMGVTIVAKPAFQEAQILLIDEENPEEIFMPKIAPYVDETDPIELAALAACGYVASAIPVTPPKDWFVDPKLDRPSPITVTDDGRVYGHVATWGQDHIGMASNTKPPRSKTNYAYFHTGVLRTEEGADVPVGQLTLAGGHADLFASASQAVKHYDDTASAVADVHAGEDKYGIWVAGGLRPGVTPEQIRALRASAPSGDWRQITFGNGKRNLELVAVCQVNVPGFPVARALAASGGSQEQFALVAAGREELVAMMGDPVVEMAEHYFEMASNTELSDKAQSLKDRVAAAKTERQAELAAKAQSLSERFRDSFDAFADVSPAARKKAAEKGEALPDGSYPIRNKADLKRAIQAFGRAKESDKAKVKRHIKKRAKALGAEDSLPDTWSLKSSEALTASVESLRERLERRKAEFASEDDADPKELTPEQLEARARQIVQAEQQDQDIDDLVDSDALEQGADQGKYTPETQPRDGQGRFRDVLARLKSTLGTSGSQNVMDKIQQTENLDNAGDYEAAVGAASDLISTIDRLDAGALNATSLLNVRKATGDLSRVIANLPLPFENQAQKVRFSDLPPALRTLTESLLDKVEAKIGAEDGKAATAELRSFMSGGDVYSQSEVSAELNRMLRLLT